MLARRRTISDLSTGVIEKGGLSVTQLKRFSSRRLSVLENKYPRAANRL